MLAPDVPDPQKHWRAATDQPQSAPGASNRAAAGSAQSRAEEIRSSGEDQSRMDRTTRRHSQYRLKGSALRAQPRRSCGIRELLRTVHAMGV